MAPRKKKAKRSKAIAEEIYDPNLPSPINSLPFEILSHIQKLAEWSYRDEHGARILVPWTCAYYFCRVNRFWRAVALKTPELWTCMTIKGKRSLKRAVAWASHTNKTPLNVKLMVNDNWIYVREMSAFDSHMDHLETFSIVMELNHVYLPHLPLYWQWDGAITSIKRLALHDIRFESIAHALNVLRSCPSLEIVSISNFAAVNRRPPSVLKAVHLPKTRIFAIYSSCSEVFISYLRMDVIEAFVVVDSWSNRSMPLETLEVDYRAGQHLYDPSKDEHLYNRLCIRPVFFAIDPAVCCVILKHLPSITVLELSYLSPEQLGNVITYLNTPDAAGSFPLPSLRRLMFRGCEVWDELLMGFEMRFQGVKRKSPSSPAALDALVIPEGNHLGEGVWELFYSHGTRLGKWFASRMTTGGGWIEWDGDEAAVSA